MTTGASVTCHNCKKLFAKAFFSSYILALTRDADPNDTLPVFCGESCMVQWSARLQNITYVEASIDFINFCKSRPARRSHE